MQATGEESTDVAAAGQGEELFQQSCIACHATSAVGESGAVDQT